MAAPAMVAWQLTRDCDLACLHCCTDSAPGKALPGELSRARALSLCREIASAGVPYAMIAGGEPTLVPHFLELCRALSAGGVLLKIETNGQNFAPEALAGLGVRSIQISLDAATEKTYAKQRIHGSLAKAIAACTATVGAGLPLEITFAPTLINIHEAAAVIELAASLGAFRFNTGRLMRLGTAARLWERLEPSEAQYRKFRAVLECYERESKGSMELRFRPFSLEEEWVQRAARPSGTLLILPDGRVKVAAPLPWICADLKSSTLLEAWDAYRAAWSDARVRAGLARLAADPASTARANDWTALEAPHDLLAMV